MNHNLEISKNDQYKAFAGDGRKKQKVMKVVKKESIFQPKYKQIGSSFILDNRDRFGDVYIQKSFHLNAPGPGSYNILRDKNLEKS